MSLPVFTSFPSQGTAAQPLTAQVRPGPDESEGRVSGNSSSPQPLGGFDATTVTVGSMVGGGIFVVLPPVAGASGTAVAAALALAALVAWCSAVSTFLAGSGLRTAADTGRHRPDGGATRPDGGATRSAAKVLLGPYPGFFAGWTLLCALVPAASVLALTFGAYVLPDHPVPAAVGAAAAATTLVLLGLQHGTWLTRFVLAFVIGVLGFGVVVAFNESGQPSLPGAPEAAASASGLLEGAAFAYFAFAGYARMAAGGYSVREPDRLLPRILPAAVLVALGLYILVGQSLLAWFSSPASLALTPAPLREPVAAVGLGIGTGAVAVAAGAACLSGLWMLMEGCARTAGAMAADGDLPRVFGRTGRSRTPWPAAAAGGAVVVLLVLAVSPGTLLGLACFGLLLHAALANLCGYAVQQQRRRIPRAVNLVGMAGALVLALSLPPLVIVLMLIVLVFGLVVRLTIRRTPPRDPTGNVPQQ